MATHPRVVMTGRNRQVCVSMLNDVKENMLIVGGRRSQQTVRNN